MCMCYLVYLTFNIYHISIKKSVFLSYSIVTLKLRSCIGNVTFLMLYLTDSSFQTNLFWFIPEILFIDKVVLTQYGMNGIWRF